MIQLDASRVIPAKSNPSLRESIDREISQLYHALDQLEIHVGREPKDAPKEVKGLSLVEPAKIAIRKRLVELTYENYKLVRKR